MKTYKIHFESDYAEMYEVFDGNGFEYSEAKEIVNAYNEGASEKRFDNLVFKNGGDYTYE